MINHPKPPSFPPFQGMVSVQEQPFDEAFEKQKVQNLGEDIGAIASFVGLVRGKGTPDKPKSVSNISLQALQLEHYPGMSEKILEDIRLEALHRWSLPYATIIHRYGILKVGEPIVLVITASSHRTDAFAACQFLMDWLKTDAPFWKAEIDELGHKHWVNAKLSDEAEKNKWR